MNSLNARKQLLIAESELNRARLAGDVTALAASFRSLADRARTLGSIASAAAELVSSLPAFKRNNPADAETKSTWLQTGLDGAGLISKIWLEIRSQNRNGVRPTDQKRLGR